jgi:V-type H+-transporting ATPase subunit a
MLFLQSIFGYLVVCILYKWSIDWSTATTQPPSLLNMLISMFLSPGTVEPETQLYRGQSAVQVILLMLAAICVPWLLIAKPFVIWKEMKKIQGQGYVGLAHGEDMPRDHSDDTLEGEEEGNGRAIVEDDKEGEVSFSIQFVLSCSKNGYFRSMRTLVRS